MAEEVQDTETVKKETPEESPDIESKVREAMRSRVSHFKEQADSLTFEGVRRLLEKDLKMEKYALDKHKRFVKDCLSECLDGAVSDKASNDFEETGEKHVDLPKEVMESFKGPESKNNRKEPFSEDEEKMEDSPVMGLLTGQKATKSKNETQSDEKKEVPNESSIKKAMLKRASYIKANSEKITMAGLRRLLEEDLKLDKLSLDPYKKFISKHLDEVLKSGEVSEPKKKVLKNNSRSKVSRKASCEERSNSLDQGSEEEEEKVKPKKKKIGSEQKMRNSEVDKKRKRPEKETKVSGKKQIKPAEKVAEDNSDAEDGGNASEDSQASVEKPLKKKEASTLAYGKRVEHLKSVIKSCGMSIPPAIYKKVKQVPENKREAGLIKELEEMLSREGLSPDPSEKEIKEVRKRKERAKELEGIDMSNIVSTSRRRSTASFVAPPKPKEPVESEGDDSDDTEDDDNNGDDDNNDDGDDNGDDESQSGETDEEHDEDSD